LRIRISIFLVLFSLFGFSQKQIKVGLALSGGGAKGMAHIGVLRALEENNVQIDYISGTSMGAVVGAMYSIGYSVDQIEAYLKNVDWDALLDNTLPRNHLSVLDRESAERYLLDFEVVDDKILAPDAFNKGQYMLKELSFLTFPAHGQTDFSKFNIPFLCVGTDLATGEAVIFEEGELSGALRASLAFPSMFSPFKIKGRKYVDGGVVNNLPIAVLKEDKGMDFVIASNVQGRLYTEEELVSVIQILEQVSSYANAMAYKEQKEKASLIINPKVLSFSLTAYDQADTISKLGYVEAMKYKDVFKKLPRKKGERDTVKDLRKEAEIYINTVEVSGVDQTTARFVKSKMRLKKPNLYTPKKLNSGLDRLYGSNYYDHLYFDLIPADTGYDLVLKLKERKSSMTLRTGLHYDDDFGIGILANVTLRNALLANSRFTMDVVFSENIRGKIAYVYDRGFIPALGIQIAFNRFGTKIYNNREAITSLTYQDFSVATFLTSTFSNNYSIGGGVKYENVNYLEDFQTLGIGRFNNNYLHTYAFLDFDNFNRKYKPSKGFKLKSEFRTISRQQEGVKFFDASSVIYARYDQAIKLNNKLGINTTLMAGGTIGADMDLPYNIYFGGLGENYNNFIFPFLGYRYMELFGRTAVMGRLDFYVEPAKNHFITAKANIGKLEPTIEGLFNESILLDGYGISYGYNSPFGPLEFTLIASTNHSAILSYLSLGFWF
jgi:NTE family protein